MHRLAALVTALLGAALLALTGAAPAAAHANVVTTDPADGAALEQSPPTLTFVVSEPVTLVDGSAQLIDADGTRYPLGPARLEDRRDRIVVPVDAALPDGAYLATARVVSADTHVVSLAVRFTVGEVTATPDWAAPTDRGVVGLPILLVVKAFEYLGTVLSAGLLFAARWAWPGLPGTRRFGAVFRVGLALAVAGLLGRLGVLVLEHAGGPAAVTWPAVAATVATPFGLAAAAAVLSAAAALWRPAGPPAWCAAVAVPAAVSLGGHGGTAALPLLLTAAHVYAVAVWLGGIAILLLVSPAVPPRWHRVAAGHAGLLLVCGLGLAVRQVDPVAALVSTGYGRTLLVKAALVAAVATAGLLAVRRVGRAVRAEAVLAVAVIGATAGLSSLTPARDSYTTDLATAVDFGDGAVLAVHIDTIRRGDQILTVEHDRSGPVRVGVELSSAQANVVRLPVRMAPSDPEGGRTRWRSEGLIVPAAGRWKVTVRYDDGNGPRLASFFYEVR